MNEMLTVYIRASCSFEATARFSDSRTARPNPSSFSARTLAALHGPYCAVDSEERVSLRYNHNRGVRP